MDPAHGPPLQARVAAANGTVLAACKHVDLYNDEDPGAHGNEQGQRSKMNRTGKSKLERGQMMRAVGMAGKGWQQAHSPQNSHCRRTQPADSPPGTGLKNQQPPDGRPRSETTAADNVGRPLAVQCRLMGGVQWCWHSGRRAQTYLAVSTPPIAFACHCTYPLP